MDPNRDHPFARFTAFWWGLGLFAAVAVLLAVVWLFVRGDTRRGEQVEGEARLAIRAEVDEAQKAFFERKVLEEGKTAQVAPEDVFALVGRDLLAVAPAAVERPEQRAVPLPDDGAPLPEIPEVDASQPLDPAVMEAGKTAYMLCAACHGPEGQGMPNVAPPLAGSEWVTGSVSNPIRIVLRGLQGPITVGDTEWNLVMAPLAFQTDEQIAAVLTFIRNSWGNEASMVTPEQVAALRGEVGKEMLTAADLEDPAAGGADASGEVPEGTAAPGETAAPEGAAPAR